MKRTLLVVTALLFSASCSNSDRSPSSTTDIEETAQQIGDVMASLDESSGSSTGTYSFNQVRSAQKMFARILPVESQPKLTELLLPNASAAACGFGGFSSCTNNVITRTFSNCTVGTATLNGTVTLTWSDAGVDNTCAMTANTHAIEREPNFTLTGRRGGTMTVQKTGVFGQRIERVAVNNYEFTNDGIQRVIQYNGTTLFDFTTTVVGGALDVTGASRNGRVLSSSGAALRVTDNSTGEYCDYTPQAVTWTNTCTCASSGLWTSTCSDGRTSSLEITGCGTATFTMGSEEQSVTFDRCSGT